MHICLAIRSIIAERIHTVCDFTAISVYKVLTEAVIYLSEEIDFQSAPF